MRIVRTAGDSVSLDFSGRAPGRGAYLCRSAACWDVAGRRRVIEHALKATVPAALAAILTAGPDAFAAAPLGTAARTGGPRSDLNPDPMSRGEAHGQE